MELKTLRVQRDEAIATVWLSRPDRLNAWTGRMHTEFRWLMDQLNTDESTRVVIITGDGRGFCAGADSKALESHVDRGGYDPGTPANLVDPAYGVRAEFDADFAWMLALDVVTMAAVNGPAAGVGFVLACYCDLRFAVEGAKLTTSHGKLNLPAEYGLSWLLPRIIGLSHANDLLLSSRVVLAEEAASMGLVNRVVLGDHLMTEAGDYARQLVELVSPASLATTKRQIALDQLHDDVGSSVRVAQELLNEMTTQPDYLEAIRVFGTDESRNWTQAPRSCNPR